MDTTNSKSKQKDNLNFDYKFGFSMPDKSVYKTKRGLNEDIVCEISKIKAEPQWMTDFRIKSYETFKEKPMPTWGGDLSGIKFDDIVYYSRSSEKQTQSWEDLPTEIKQTYDKIGVPEAEKNFLAGVSAQYDSEVVYESIQKELKKIGVIFCDMDTGLRKYPRIVKEYFGKLIPPHDNKFAALNSAMWSGGSFVYVPKGVHVTLPLQAYFRINSERFGQFERTLIIAEEGSYVHYIEGCTAPIYVSDSLHAAVVEIFVKPHARVRYTTVQNWSNNVYNLVTKRALPQQPRYKKVPIDEKIKNEGTSEFIFLR
jgi:Fe-S cluster assembly protein SufB